MLIKKPLILASASQRRQQLFRQIGLKFEIRESGVDETFVSNASVSENVERLALDKARSVGN